MSNNEEIAFNYMEMIVYRSFTLYSYFTLLSIEQLTSFRTNEECTYVARSVAVWVANFSGQRFKSSDVTQFTTDGGARAPWAPP